MKKQRLSDAYRFKGFVPEHEVQEVVGDDCARTVRLKRRQKKQFVLNAAQSFGLITTTRPGVFAICPAATCEYSLKLKSAGHIANGVTW